MKLILLALALSLPLVARCERKTTDVWLTPERARQLRGLADRPTVVRRERINDETAVYHWKNGAVTTQRVERIIGKPSRNAWRDKLDAKDREKQSLLDDLKAVKNKPTKKDLEYIINKHGGGWK